MLCLIIMLQYVCMKPAGALKRAWGLHIASSIKKLCIATLKRGALLSPLKKGLCEVPLCL